MVTRANVNPKHFRTACGASASPDRSRVVRFIEPERGHEILSYRKESGFVAYCETTVGWPDGEVFLYQFQLGPGPEFKLIYRNRLRPHSSSLNLLRVGAVRIREKP